MSIGEQILKLRKFRVSGFKALDGLTLSVPGQRLVLVGRNGSGKSSALQALGLFRDFATGATHEFFLRRGWSPRDIKSKVSHAGSVVRFDLHLSNDDQNISYVWQINYSLNSGRNIRELLWVISSGVPSKIFEYRDRDLITIETLEIALRGTVLKGSLLSVIDTRKSNHAATALLPLIDWANGITSLELLSPNAMRGGARGAHTDIGQRGERLASFLASLDAQGKARVVGRIAEFYPLSNLETTRKRAGWVDLKIAETFNGMGPIGASHVSDGFLRLLALSAIPEFGSNVSLVLLDEVEDGIEPHILPRVIDRLTSQTSAQLLMTSHSPLLINFMEPDEVTLLGRSPDGRAISARLSSISTIEEGLEHFGTGELWAMMDRDQLEDKIAGEEKISSRPFEGPPRLSSAGVLSFTSS